MNLSKTMKNSGKISVVFFGSGPVAAQCLELLLHNFDVEAVITKPKPPHHKYDVPVLQVAQKYHLPTLTASNKKELDAVIATNNFHSKLAILIDFGIIVSNYVIDAFPLGIVNSHFSLLPRWRGADPITFAITSGDAKTGVSLMLIDEGMDTGKLLTTRTLPLTHTETGRTLTTQLIGLSNDLIAEFIPRYIKGDITPKNQPHPDRATYARKLTKQDGIIDWSESAEQIERHIRGYIEWPQSRANLNGLDVIITGARATEGNGVPGSYTIHGKELIIYARVGALSITTLKPAGKKEMPIAAFLAGYSKNL